MKYIKIILAIILTASFAVSCMSKKDISAEDFLKIEDEVLKSDLSQSSKETIAKKYGYTLQQYVAAEEKARTDDKFKEKLGAVRLKTAPTKDEIKK
jgi:uncharacterized protein YxeA